MEHKYKMILALVLVLIVFACCGIIALFGSSGKSTSPGGAPGSVQGTANAPTAYLLGQSFVVGDLQYVVNNVRENTVIESNNMFIPDNEARSGAKFIIFDFQVENIGKKSASASSLNLKIHDTAGREFDVAGCEDAENQDFGGYNLEPGLSASYSTCYSEVPQNVGRLTLEIKDNAFFSTSSAKVQLN